MPSASMQPTLQLGSQLAFASLLGLVLLTSHFGLTCHARAVGPPCSGKRCIAGMQLAATLVPRPPHHCHSGSTTIFPECKVCESYAGGQYGNLANLANHQAGGYTTDHRPAVHWISQLRFISCPVGGLCYFGWVIWVMLHPKVLTKSAHLRLIDERASGVAYGVKIMN